MASATPSRPSAPSGYLAKTKAALLRDEIPPAPTFGTLLVVEFSPAHVPRDLPKTIARQGRDALAQTAASEYAALIERLEKRGLKVTSRKAKERDGRPNDKGKVWIFVTAGDDLLQELAEKERSDDFLHGVSAMPKSSQVDGLTKAERLRLVHNLITGTLDQGGLAISPELFPWPHVTNIFALHDEDVNDKWTRSWLGRDWTVGLFMRDHEIDMILENFGPSIALYFSYLSLYTRFTLPLAAVGLTTFFLGWNYSSLYGALVSLWGIFFVETWRIKETSLAHRFGTFNIENRPQLRTAGSPMAQNRPWWKQDLKSLTSVVPLLLCAAFLVVVITSLFILEAFVTALYKGPGKEYTSLIPTLLFAVIVPRILTIYRGIAERLTKWEDHASEIDYQNALTAKTFALNSIVAFAGLFLSAFVYIPFGEQVMAHVDNFLFSSVQDQTVVEKSFAHVGGPDQFSQNKQPKGRGVINQRRLQDQMFAYTVTNQIINAATELVLPIVMRWYAEYKSGESSSVPKIDHSVVNEKLAAGSGVGAQTEEAFLQKVEREGQLPDYSLFADYAEMVTQFGYVTLWSICWPLASVPVFVNNYFELRSDALKICLNSKKPIPARVASIGPWLTSLTFINWLSVLTNAALYTLFHPSTTPSGRGASFLSTSQHAHLQAGDAPSVAGTAYPLLLVTALASHVFLVVHFVVRYTLRKLLWDGSAEATEVGRREREVRAEFLQRHTDRRESFAAGAQKHRTTQSQQLASNAAQTGGFNQKGGEMEVNRETGVLENKRQQAEATVLLGGASTEAGEYAFWNGLGVSKEDVAAGFKTE